MNIPHFMAMVLFAFFVAVVFAVLGRDTLRDRVRYGIKIFLAFMGIAIGLGWLMYPFPP